MSKLIKLHQMAYSDEPKEDGRYDRVKGEPVLVNPTAVLYVCNGYNKDSPHARIKYNFDISGTEEVWESVEEIAALLEGS